MKQRERDCTMTGQTAESLPEDIIEREAYYRLLAERNGRRSLREIDRMLDVLDEFRKTEATLKSQIKRDSLLSTISARLLELPFTRIRKCIADSLESVGRYYDVDRILVLVVDERREALVKISSWHDPGSSHDMPKSLHILLSHCRGLLDMANTHDVINIPDINDIPDENARAYFSKTDLKSMAAAPMITVERLIGVVVIEMTTKHRHWNEEDLIGFKMLADIFANALTREINGRQRRMLEEQLQIRQRMDSLGTLASGIAHDFNNLLVAIMGNLDLLLHRDEGMTDFQRNYIREAFQASRRAARLTGEIQSLSRETVSHQTVVDIHAVIDEVLVMLERTTDRLIEKKLLFRSDEYFVTGNADQLHQVFLNLGTNAAHAITEKGVAAGDFISASARKYIAENGDKRGLAAGPYVHVVFADNGTGMTDDVRKRAFDPLFTTRRGSGMGQGLGLAMVYTIITKKHAGHIDIESVPGEGTKVHLYLPLAKKPVSSSMPETTMNIAGTETVLLIEDEESVREAVSQTLQYFGYTVLNAVDGEEGLYKFTDHLADIDLVLLDLSMPKLPGWEVFKRMQDISPDIPVIITSGHNEMEFEGHPVTAGFMQKPYEIAALGGMIRSVLDDTRSS